MARRWVVWIVVLVLEMACLYTMYRHVEHALVQVVHGTRRATGAVVGQPIGLIALLWILAESITEMTAERVSTALAFAAACVLGIGLVIIDHL
jgi:hypothetical protein